MSMYDDIFAADIGFAADTEEAGVSATYTDADGTESDAFDVVLGLQRTKTIETETGPRNTTTAMLFASTDDLAAPDLENGFITIDSVDWDILESTICPVTGSVQVTLYDPRKVRQSRPESRK